MVDVVAAEPRAHQLLEQVGFLVGALGRAEADQRVLAVRSRIALSWPPANASASSQVASRNTSITRSGSIVKSPVLGTPARRISGTVRRCGWCA